MCTGKEGKFGGRVENFGQRYIYIYVFPLHFLYDYIIYIEFDKKKELDL